jgi:Tfp pilus assembly protein PilF
VSPTNNFNYQVELKQGLGYLKQGRLRQAEHSFRYLMEKFPGAEGGYRGLAKVRFEQDDRAGALSVLRDGAAALVKAGERAAAIGLLREAIALDPRDMTTHRRLAAALALAGDNEAAVQEYARYIRDLRETGDIERAKLEASYATGQLRHVPGAAMLTEIANSAGAADAPAETPSRAGGTLRPEPSDPWASAPKPPSSREIDPWSASSASETTDDAVPRGWAPPEPAPRGPEPFSNEPWYFEPPLPTADVTPLPFVEVPQTPAESGAAALADDAEVEAAAARYLATRDPRAAALALEAARRYIQGGHTDAASDLLLQLIAAGVADHDAQRLLVDVARSLGKQDVARAKCQLLVQALLLDGRNELAAEVEALARND